MFPAIQRSRQCDDKAWQDFGFMQALLVHVPALTLSLIDSCHRLGEVN